MSCFEARKDFRAFWRRTMPLDARAHMVRHLGECSQCDRAFRAFALIAPVIHAGNQPHTAKSASRSRNSVRPRPTASTRSPSFARREPRRIWQVAAAAVLVALGGLTAWSSTRWPRENFAQSVVADSPATEIAGYSSDASATLFDAGAQVPAVFESITSPPSSEATNNLAG